VTHKSHEDKAAGKANDPDPAPLPADKLFQVLCEREQMFVMAPDMGATLAKWRARLEDLCGESVGEAWPETVTEVADEVIR